MKYYLIVIFCVLSFNVSGDVQLPHESTPMYNKYFKKCVESTDAVMLRFVRVFRDVDETTALRFIDTKYSNSDRAIRILFKDMVKTLYNQELEFEEKLDQQFYKCLNVANIIVRNSNESR